MLCAGAFMNTDAFHPRARSDPVAVVVRSPTPVDAGPVDAEPDSEIALHRGHVDGLVVPPS